MATHPQLLRIIEGAVKNAFDAHPRWKLIAIQRKIFARSVGKRAAGTILAMMPELLAAATPTPSGPDQRGKVTAADPAGLLLLGQQSRGGERLPGFRRSPFRSLQKELSRRVGAAKRAGEWERAAALIEVLKLLAEADPSRF